MYFNLINMFFFFFYSKQLVKIAVTMYRVGFVLVKVSHFVVMTCCMWISLFEMSTNCSTACELLGSSQR